MLLGHQNLDDRAVFSADICQAGQPCACHVDLGVLAGWDLVQRDWALRQREPGNAPWTRLVRRLTMRIEAASTCVRILAGRMLRCIADIAHVCSPAKER